MFRSIRDGLLTGRKRSSLVKLNEDLDAWISDYHNRVHSSLGKSPLNKKCEDKYDIKQLDNIMDVDSLFTMEEMKTIYSDGCIRLRGIKYDVPRALTGTKIKIFYVPWDLSVVHTEEGAIYPLNKIKNAHRFNNPKSKG